MTRSKAPQGQDQGPNCGNCRHYENRAEAGDQVLWGACRRFPPVWFMSEEVAICDFSQTDPAQRCGEWGPSQ